MSSDYVDIGLMPEEGSQYWVALIIQNAFGKYVKTTRPDIADELKSKTFMQLQ